MLGVFLVSAVVHEYIFCFVLGFFTCHAVALPVFGGELGLRWPSCRDILREPGDSRLMGEAT